MARVGLALCLIFATTAGPWLCCCTGDRLFDRLSATKHSQTTGSCCCNHRATGEVHHVLGDKQHPETPTPHNPCPCRDGVPPPIAALVVKSFLNADSARAGAWSQEFVPWVLSAADPLAWHPPAQTAGFAFASPVQNPRDILSLLHALRC